MEYLLNCEVAKPRRQEIVEDLLKEFRNKEVLPHQSKTVKKISILNKLRVSGIDEQELDQLLVGTLDHDHSRVRGLDKGRVPEHLRVVVVHREAVALGKGVAQCGGLGHWLYSLAWLAIFLSSSSVTELSASSWAMSTVSQSTLESPPLSSLAAA